MAVLKPKALARAKQRLKDFASSKQNIEARLKNKAYRDNEHKVRLEARVKELAGLEEEVGKLVKQSEDAGVKAEAPNEAPAVQVQVKSKEAKAAKQ